MDVVRENIKNAKSLKELQEQENKINILMQLSYSKYDLEKITQLYQNRKLELKPPSVFNITQVTNIKEKLPNLGSTLLKEKARQKQDMKYDPYVAEHPEELLKAKSKGVIIENLENSYIFLPLPVIHSDKTNKSRNASNINSIASIGRVQLVNLLNCNIIMHNPIKSDLYILNCANCEIYGLCHQLRISGSNGLKLQVYSKSSPIQEHSSGIDILPFKTKAEIAEDSEVFELMLNRYKYQANLINKNKEIRVVDFNHKEQ
eukprot:NODE_719_length_4821_cov_0.698009.p2 type:complete len:260 gc:universal NODE_719_length_4821_cov_0.698009:4654-3875(-)